MGDEKLTSREDRIGPLFMYVQSVEDTFLKVNEVSSAFLMYCLCLRKVLKTESISL